MIYLAYPLHHLCESGEFLYAVYTLLSSLRALSPDVNLVLLLASLASLSLSTLSSRLARLVAALFGALVVLSASRELPLALSL